MYLEIEKYTLRK